MLLGALDSYEMRLGNTVSFAFDKKNFRLEAKSAVLRPAPLTKRAIGGFVCVALSREAFSSTVMYRPVPEILRRKLLVSGVA
jgi:hypothetical protein